MTWDNPLAGSLTEEYLVSEDGTQLAVTSDMRIGQRQAKATQVRARAINGQSGMAGRGVRARAGWCAPRGWGDRCW